MLWKLIFTRCYFSENESWEASTKDSSCRDALQFAQNLLISFFYFTYQDKFENVFHKGQDQFLYEFMNEPSHGIIWSPEDLTFQDPRQPRIKISIGFILLPSRRITTLSFLFEEHSPERDHLNKELINKHLSIFSASSFTLCTLFFYEDTRRLQSNRVERNAEFVFSPQHGTSCDPETTTKEDADHWRKIIEERNSEVTDEFTASQTKLNIEDIIHCRIVLAHLLYNDARREQPKTLEHNIEKRSRNHYENCNRNY